MDFDLVINHGEVLAYKNGKVLREPLHIGISQGKISALSSTSLSGKQQIDARHLYILPGVIDTQVHFREPGMTHKEDLETGTKAAAMGGVTTVFEMPNTQPPTTTIERLNEKFKLAEGRAWVNFAFYGGGNVENLQELSSLEQTQGCSGIKIFMGSSFGTLLVNDDASLEKVLSQCHRRVIVHAEDEARLQERKKIVLESKNIVDHNVWRDVQTALLATQRLLKLARKLGKKVHVLHVTTKEEVELLSQNKDIASFEITPNHLTFFAPDCYQKLGTLVQMNPPIREKSHQDALWNAIRNGNADTIGTDHAPHTLQEKSIPYPGSPSGMPGVQTLVPMLLTHIHEGRMSLERFVEMVGENPRRLFGCASKGRIEVGLDADFTIVDLKKEQIIEDKWIVSRCGWTPFNGMKATGWPTHTIIAGKTIMQNGELLLPGQGQKVLFDLK